MWAGPLCGHLLAAAGATVVKVEGRGRPDGTRRGDPRFFDWMNSSKLSYAIDFRDDDLRPLLEVADVVIEGSRPAALTRRGLGPEQVRGRPGRVWLRVTGYGTEGDRANRVAFGDDAAVAGGLVGAGPVFIGDAIADPLTGLAATLAVLDALGRGGGEIVEIALAEVAASYATLPLAAAPKIDEPPQASGTGTACARARRRQPTCARVGRNQARDMLIRRGTLPDGRVADIRVEERILEIADSLDPLDSEQVLDAAAGAVLPGLHDHHLHLRAMAAALDSLAVGPPQVRTKAQLAQALATAVPGPDGWIRAVGYHASVAGELDREQLDALIADTPLRIQHRSGAMWILNSAGPGPRRTGRPSGRPVAQRR